MEIVLELEAKNLQKLKEILNKDDLTSRASITSREGSIIGKKNYFLYISGTDEQIKKILELSKDLAKRAEEKDEKAVIAKIKEEEQSAGEGMGAIFG